MQKKSSMVWTSFCRFSSKTSLKSFRLRPPSSLPFTTPQILLIAHVALTSAWQTVFQWCVYHGTVTTCLEPTYRAKEGGILNKRNESGTSTWVWDVIMSLGRHHESGTSTWVWDVNMSLGRSLTFSQPSAPPASVKSPTAGQLSYSALRCLVTKAHTIPMECKIRS